MRCVDDNETTCFGARARAGQERSRTAQGADNFSLSCHIIESRSQPPGVEFVKEDQIAYRNCRRCKLNLTLSPVHFW